MSWASWANEQLDAIGSEGRLREPRIFESSNTTGTIGTAGEEVVSFASNDYLGLRSHPSVRQAAIEAVRRLGTGSGSARLIVGTRKLHEALEEELAEWKSADNAVLFPTGFAANIGVLSVVGTAGATIFSDELNHASIIDGCRLSHADVAIYRHCDVGQLNSLMRISKGPCVVVTDSVFSMDGDVAPLSDLATVCAARGALLVVDEAHAVLGPELPLVEGLEVLRVGTLSKHLGSLGGFVAGPSGLCRLIVNRARSYIFSTAPTPADTAAALAALKVLRAEEGSELIERLRSYVDRVAPGQPSPIIPLVVGDERTAASLSSALLERRILVPCIRPPTVPPGSSRLRVTLSAAHTDTQVDLLVKALADLGLAGAAGAGIST